MDNFTQYLIVFLILLLFAKELVYAFAQKRGWINGKENGNGYQKQIDALGRHADIANEEMGVVKQDIATIKTDISTINKDVAYIKGLLEAKK